MRKPIESYITPLNNSYYVENILMNDLFSGTKTNFEDWLAQNEIKPKVKEIKQLVDKVFKTCYPFGASAQLMKDITSTRYNKNVRFILKDTFAKDYICIRKKRGINGIGVVEADLYFVSNRRAVTPDFFRQNVIDRGQKILIYSEYWAR